MGIFKRLPSFGVLKSRTIVYWVFITLGSYHVGRCADHIRFRILGV